MIINADSSTSIIHEGVNGIPTIRIRTMKSIFWLIIICYQLLVKKCYTAELKVKIELVNYSWKNLDKVQSFFSEVFPIEYQLHHYVEMMHGDLVKLAFHGKKMIGFLYSHTAYEESNVFLIGSIGCLPSYKRRGVGSYLFELALNYARQKGTYEIIRLYVQTSNNVALKFYKKYGFKIVKEEADYYINTVDTNAYKMEKIIYPKKKYEFAISKNEKNLSTKNLTRMTIDVRLMFAMKLKEMLKREFDPVPT